MSLHRAKTLPGIFRRVRLERAGEGGDPADRSSGYTLLAPLRADWHLDVRSARYYSEDCKVTRFRRGHESEAGYLHRRPDGFWVFQHDPPESHQYDDPAYKLAQHRFATGDYITILEDDGAHIYRVASVDAL